MFKPFELNFWDSIILWDVALCEATGIPAIDLRLEA